MYKIILIFIIFTAAFLRFYQLDKFPPGLYADEAMNGNNAIQALATGEFKVFYPENQGREGLFINVQAVFLKFLTPFFGNEPWILRLPSAIFGSLTVLGVYFLARELFIEIQNSKGKSQNYNSKFKSKSTKWTTKILHFAFCVLTSDSNRRMMLGYKVALLSAFFMATSFWHINFSRIGFRAIMAPFFLTWSLYFLLLSLRNPKFTTPRVVNLGLAVLGGFLYGIGFYTYIAYRVTPLLFLFLMRRDNWKNLFVFFGAAFLVFLPLLVYFSNHPADFFGRTASISIFTSPAPWRDLAVNILKIALMFNFVGDFNWRHNLAGRPLVFLPVGLLFIAGLIRGLYLLVQNSKLKIIIWWLVIAALPVVISNEALPHALRSLLFTPPVFILAGFGGIWFYENFIKRYVLWRAARGAFILIFFGLLIFEAYTSYFILWGSNSNVPAAFDARMVKIGREINGLPKSLPKYVIYKEENGLPSLALQPIMFVTNTYLEAGRKGINLHYLPESQIKSVSAEATVFKL